MNVKTAPKMDDFDDLASPRSTAWMLGGAVIGAGLALLVLPTAGPALAAALSGPEPKVWWYLSRASGLVSYALLSASMLLGLLLSTKFAKAWPGNAAAFALHEHTSVLGLAFALFHAIVLLGDRHTPFTLLGLLLPFGASFKPLAVGAGQLAFYGAALLVGSFYVRKRLGQRTWRLIHFGSFMVFVLALLHGLATGTDRVVMMFGIVPAAATFFFGTYRALAHLLAERGDPRPRPVS